MAAVKCGAKVWRCANCGNTVSQGHVTSGAGCPKCPDSTVEESTCRIPVTPPVTKCRLHGGNASQVVASVAAQVQREGAERLVAKLAIPADDQHPVETLLNQLRLTRGMVNMLTELVQGLDGTVARMEWNPDIEKLVPVGEDGIAGATYHQSGIPTGEAKPHVFVAMLKDWSAELNKLLIDCAKLGIEERRLAATEQIEQTQIERLFAAFNRAAARALPTEVAEGFRQAFADELRQEEQPAIER